MKKFQFKINGKFYDVELIKVEDTAAGTVMTSPSPQPQQVVSTPAPQAQAAVVSEPEVKKAPSSGAIKGYIVAPLPGIMRAANVKPGDRIKNGDTVCVLEAMKMENNIFADIDGVVLEILVTSGVPVLEGDKLIAIGE